MLYIQKIDDYLEILTYEEVKDFVAKNFNETIKKKKKILEKLLNRFTSF